VSTTTSAARFADWLRRQLEPTRRWVGGRIDAWLGFPPGEHGLDDGDQEGVGTPSVGALVREGRLIRLRTHVPANRAAFQRWYADDEIVRLLRHDQLTLTPIQSRGYFDSIILPLSARGLCFAIHEIETDDLIGTTALSDLTAGNRSALFRIVIGEKDRWGLGYGTEATSLVAWEAFTRLGLGQIRLEVFRHNERAIAVYDRIGFLESGAHVEWVGPTRYELHVVEMVLDRERFFALQPGGSGESGSRSGAGTSTPAKRRS
jgi:RimJ/RimL family protein N-acetyltransferase